MGSTIRISVVILLFVAFGLAATPVFSGMMDGIVTGSLTGAGGHNASGTVAITKDNNGRIVLNMADIRVDRVPDGRVYLAKNGDYMQGVELGKLTQFDGAVSFTIPTSVKPEDYDSVVIWCRKFDVEIGHAFFGKVMMK